MPIRVLRTRRSTGAGGAHIHVHDQVGGFGERVRLHAQRVVQVLGGREELARVPLQQLHALVPVVLRAMPRLGPDRMFGVVDNIAWLSMQRSKGSAHVPRVKPYRVSHLI